MIESQISLLAAIVCIAIAISIQIRGRRSALHLYFVVLNAVLATWNLSAFLHQLLGQGLWLRISMLAALAIPWSALRFFQTFLGEASRLASGAGRITAVVSLLLAPLMVSPLYNSSWVMLVVLTYVFFVLYFCIFLIYRRLVRTESRVEAARLWYIAIGGLIAITFSLTDYLPRLDVVFPLVGSVFTIIFMYFLSQILIQYRLLDLTEFFGKIATLGMLVSLLAAIQGVLIYVVGDQPGVFFLASVVASFVVLILFEPLRDWVEATIARYSLRERFEFGRQLNTLRREMANVLELGAMVQLLFERFEDTRRITHAGLYLLEGDAQSYKCIGHVGPRSMEVLDVVSGRAFLDRLRSGWLVREELEDELVELREQDEPSVDGDSTFPGPTELEQLEDLLTMMDELEAGVVFPIHSEERLIGFLTMLDARVPEAYTPDELRGVQGVAQQIAIVVENSKLVEKLRERDRLAALGEMSAGLAHEIRNPLGAIKGAAQLLVDEEDVDEAREFLDVIVEEVDRLNTVVSQFLDYARPDRGQLNEVEINPCAERVIQLVRQRAEECEVEILVELDESLPNVRAEANKLTQVLLNLALNAIDAMEGEEQRQLSITSSLARRRERAFGGAISREVVEIAISDTGRGMAPEEVRNIFIPFYTTKQSGTGLGLAICQRLVKSFGGTIEVRSQPGQGTHFSVHLPIWGEEAITGVSLRRSLVTHPAEKT